MFHIIYNIYNTHNVYIVFIICIICIYALLYLYVILYIISFLAFIIIIITCYYYHHFLLLLATYHLSIFIIFTTFLFAKFIYCLHHRSFLAPSGVGRGGLKKATWLRDPRAQPPDPPPAGGPQQPRAVPPVPATAAGVELSGGPFRLWGAKQSVGKR